MPNLRFQVSLEPQSFHRVCQGRTAKLQHQCQDSRVREGAFLHILDLRQGTCPSSLKKTPGGHMAQAWERDSGQNPFPPPKRTSASPGRDPEKYDQAENKLLSSRADPPGHLCVSSCIIYQTFIAGWVYLWTPFFSVSFFPCSTTIFFHYISSIISRTI